MNQKTIACVALSNRDYASLDDKLAEAVRWVEFAAGQGADLVVLPEMLNFYCGDGAGNKRAMSMEQAALDDWQAQTQVLAAAARRCQVALTVPVVIRESGGLANVFFLLDRNGQALGRYQKMCPTRSELQAGVRPGAVSLIHWEGLRIGGGICFDCYYPHVWDQQAAAGADLFLVPSLTAGGDMLNSHALRTSVPIALAYPAWSRIIDADGKDLVGMGYRSETLRFGFGAPVILATINFNRVVLFADFNQMKIVELQQAYGKRVAVRFDQPNALFTVESRDPNLPIEQIIERFELIPRRQYFAQSGRLIDQAAAAAPSVAKPTAGP